MSVIHFDSSELANVARVAAGGDFPRFATFCCVLSEYSEANTRAYLHTYKRETAERWTVRDLRAAMVESRKPSLQDLERAVGTLGLLRYNAVANDGTDFATRELVGGLADIARALIDVLREAMAAQSTTADPSIRARSLTLLRMAYAG